ncbi:MAG TPA: hypothetical protein VMB81_12460, partial [Candidatus Sulfotelmatobacter sp.]|nr:hypothetical protein [Candidatus Sulfotelmatobacter sp.]
MTNEAAWDPVDPELTSGIPWRRARCRPAHRAKGGHVIAAWNSVVAGFPVLLLQLAVTTAIF